MSRETLFRTPDGVETTGYHVPVTSEAPKPQGSIGFEQRAHAMLDRWGEKEDLGKEVILKRNGEHLGTLYRFDGGVSISTNGYPHADRIMYDAMYAETPEEEILFKR